MVGDPGEHVAQGGFVGGVAAHDFVGDGKSVGGDDQGDDDLQAVGAFAVVDLAKIEQGLLNGFAGGDAAVFHDAPVAILLAVLEAFVLPQKHDLRLRPEELSRTNREQGYSFVFAKTHEPLRS